jgi:hypothetical protein
MTLSNRLKNDIKKKKQQNLDNIVYFKEQILITDALKEDYDDAIVSIDENLLKDIDAVNATLVGVQSAYQNRVDNGCRTDLFWSVTSYTPGAPDSWDLLCRKLSLSGYGSSVTVVDSSGGITTYSADTVVIPGVEASNLYGIKYYDQPYLRDIGDTTIGSFVGIVGAASTILSIVSQSSDEVASSFEVGNLIISSKEGVFSGGSNRIVGFGSTTITGISTVVMNDVVGIVTSSLNVSTILLENTTIGFSSLPESDGSYVEFTVVSDTQTFDEENPRFKYRVKFTKNPFSPEKVGILSEGTVGIGVSIQYDNSGKPSESQSWKPEFEGVIKGGEKIKEPKVGAGKIYNIVGFTDKPVIPSSGDASEGSAITVTSLTGLYSAITPPGGCTAIENNLTNAISVRDAAEASISAGSSCLGNKIEAANSLRVERSEYALKIWGLRQSIGGESDRVDDYEALETYINDTENTINQTGSTSCI